MMQSVLATRAAAILDFLQGIGGTLHVTFEIMTDSMLLPRLNNLTRRNSFITAKGKEPF